MFRTRSAEAADLMTPVLLERDRRCPSVAVCRCPPPRCRGLKVGDSCTSGSLDQSRGRELELLAIRSSPVAPTSRALSDIVASLSQHRCEQRHRRPRRDRGEAIKNHARSAYRASSAASGRRTSMMGSISAAVVVVVADGVVDAGQRRDEARTLDDDLPVCRRRSTAGRCNQTADDRTGDDGLLACRAASRARCAGVRSSISVTMQAF